MDTHNFKTIAKYHGPLKQKFGVPRQAGLVEELAGQIVFAEEYRNKDALRGLGDFSHLWLIWVFSENKAQEKFKASVRPPRLGGDKTLGVWATRSPNRPNQIGLSAVELESIELDSPDGPIIHVKGADLVDGTPILDIKPYLPYADIISGADGGFAQVKPEGALRIVWQTANPFESEDSKVLESVLANDPRPAYQDDPERIYGMTYQDKNIKFKVKDDSLFIVQVEDE